MSATRFGKKAIRVGFDVVFEFRHERFNAKARRDRIEEFDEAAFATRAPGIRQALLSQAQGQLLQDWFEAKLAQADVQDLRYAW